VTDREESSSLSLARLINRVCREFAQAWRDERAPRIEEYADRVPEAMRTAALRELIAQEMDLRIAAGDSVAAQEYLDRFPQARNAVEAASALVAG